MKSLVELTVRIVQDCAMQCGANPSRDLLTITSRSEMEGDSFLTITLPSFSRAFERALELGCLSPSLFPGFRFEKRRRLPRFLSGFVERIFDRHGVLLDDADSDCIFAVRQICLLQKKVRLPCTRARQRAAESAFIKCEADLRAHVFPLDLLNTFKSVGRIIWSDILRSAPYGDPFLEYHPKHGPGTTNEGIRGNKKFSFLSWPSRMEREFPFLEFGCASIRNLNIGNSLYPVTQTAPRDELPVRVVFVPKTLKTPRVIGIEPVCMQFIQQSISTWLKSKIEKSCSFTSGHVNFTHQSVNNQFALSSSIDKSFATLDLNEASDRVSCSLVWDMLASVPTFRRQVFACRTTRAKLPSGKIIALRKFASMGSALCFPMESMVFYCAIVSILIHNAGVRVTPRTIRKYSAGLFIYGDDIIVPTDVAPLVCNKLPDFCLKVNTAKSFWNGNFRESCGVDAYKGIQVTPVYSNYVLPTDKTDPRVVVASVAFANHLYRNGLWKTARYVREKIELLLGSLPISNDDSQHLGWLTYRQGRPIGGWSKRYQRTTCRCWVPSPVRQDDPLSDDPALLKCFGLIGIPTIDPKHLLESVRYGNLALKRRWI